MADAAGVQQDIAAMKATPLVQEQQQQEHSPPLDQQEAAAEAEAEAAAAARKAAAVRVDRLLINLNHYKHNVGGADPLAALGALDIEEEVEEEKGEEDEGAMDVQGDEEAAGERGGKPSAIDPMALTLPALIARMDGLLTAAVDTDSGISPFTQKSTKGLFLALTGLFHAAMDSRGGTSITPTTAAPSLAALLQATHALLTHRALLPSSSTASPRTLLSPRQMAELAEKAERLLELSRLLQQGPTPMPPPDPRSLLDPSSQRAKELEALLLAMYQQLTPPPERTCAIEAARARLNAVLCRNHNFRDGRVHVFGSALSELGTARSDVDYCLMHPGMEREAQAREQRMDEARAALLAVAKESPHVVRLVLRREKLRRGKGKHGAALSGRRNKAQQMEARVARLEEDLQALTAAAGNSVNVQIAEVNRKLVLARRDLKVAVADLWETEKQLAAIVAHMQRIEEELAASPEQAARAESARRRVKACEEEISEAKSVVFSLKRTLERAGGYSEVFAIHRARIPIVKFRDASIPCPPPQSTATQPSQPVAPTATKPGRRGGGGGGGKPEAAEKESPVAQADLCINNVAAVYNTQMIAAYIRVDGRLRALIFLVKAWARAHGLNEARFGSLSSYAYSLLCIGYMQAIGLLPSLQDPTLLASAAQCCRDTYRGLDVSFCQDADFARSFNPRPDPALSLSHLLLGFFHFYGHVFNPATSVLSVRLARLLDKKDIPPALGKSSSGSPSWRLSIEDPFESFVSPRPHDLGDVLNVDAQARMLSGFRTMLQVLPSTGDSPQELAAALFGDEGIRALADFWSSPSPCPLLPATASGGSAKSGPAQQSSLAGAGSGARPQQPLQSQSRQPQPQQKKLAPRAEGAAVVVPLQPIHPRAPEGKVEQRERHPAPTSIPRPLAPQQQKEQGRGGEEKQQPSRSAQRRQQQRSRQKKNQGGGSGGDGQEAAAEALNPPPAAVSPTSLPLSSSLASQPPSATAQGQGQGRTVWSYGGEAAAKSGAEGGGAGAGGGGGGKRRRRKNNGANGAGGGGGQGQQGQSQQQQQQQQQQQHRRRRRGQRNMSSPSGQAPGATKAGAPTAAPSPP